MPYFNYSDQRIHYRIEGNGPLLLILPGNTASSKCHCDDLAYFSQTFSAAAIDYLGVGMSDRLTQFGRDWFRSCADQAAALIRHIGKPAVLIGTSGGAVVALHTAARHTDLVTAVVADSFTPRFTREMLEKNVLQDRSVRSEGQIGFWRNAHGEDWERVVKADTAMLTSMVKEGGNWLENTTQEVRCPVLITTSLEDQMLKHPLEYSLEMLNALKDGRLFISPHGEHPLMWGKPDIFRQAVQGFLAFYSNHNSTE